MFALGHLCFHTNNLEKMIDFYTTLFSSKVVHQFKNEKDEVYGVCIEIGNKTYIELFNSELNLSNDSNQNFKHFSIEASNLEATLNHLSKLNIQSELVIGKTDKTKQVHISDPDLNKIEIQFYDNNSLMKEHSIFFKMNN